MAARPGRCAAQARCPLLVLVCDQDQAALAGPAARAAQRAPHSELVRLPGGHDQPFLAGHERAVEAELSFLRRHLLAGSPAAGPATEPAAVRKAGMTKIELSAGPIQYTDTGGDGPVLVFVYGRRLAELVPRGRLVEVADSYALIPLDQPTRFAEVIREFPRTAAPA